MTTDLPTDSFRLPLDVKPTHYDVTIKTDLENSLFEGVVKIKYVHTHCSPNIVDQFHQPGCQEGNLYHRL
jgi:hypothetical protein